MGKDLLLAAQPSLGVCIADTGEAHFALFAPNKRSVHLIGDFNHWVPGAQPLTETQGLWQTNLCLPPGRHRYKFLVDGALVVGDPYAREIEREATDNEAPAAIVHMGGAPFPWRHDAWARPPFQDLIFYEALVHDFTPEQTFTGVTGRLDYLRRLGINALELMPVYAARRNDNWGYEPNYFFAPHPEYGRPEDLKRLVDEAHGHGIAIVLDIVLAHTGHDHTFNRLYAYDQSVWYGQTFGAENEYGLPPFDHEKATTQSFCRDVIRFWLNEYHVDGFRLDYVNLIDEKDGLGVPQLISNIRECRPDAYITSEMLPEDPEKTSRWDNDAAWHWHIGMLLRELLLADTGYKLTQKHEGWRGFMKALTPEADGYSGGRKMINYCESHDEERLTWFLREAGLPEEQIVKRVGLAATILFTMAGEPMLYHGQEFGESTRMLQTGNPLHWEALTSSGGASLHHWFQQLIALRQGEAALRSNNFQVVCERPSHRCVAYRRWDEHRQVVVVANLSPAPQRITVPFPEAGSWKEFYSGDEFCVRQRKTLHLAAFSSMILRRLPE
ncbi:MAG: DUF3459 domain-containing protein [Candidatus Hydrogenedentes bacterium]|nr:DUF3459 domain-containing protein [Candidatus Hydrogenedentota bacterium]